MMARKSTDKRSASTRLKLSEVKSFHRQAKRILARIEVCIDDAEDEGIESLSAEYWASAELALQRLEAVAKGIEKAVK